MPFSLVPTVFIEAVLNASTHPDADKAIEELRRLRAVQSHLMTHFAAVQRQTQASGAGLRDVVGDVQPRSPWGLVE